MQQRLDYGIDAPGVIRNLLVIGATLIVSGLVFPTIHLGPVTVLWGRSAPWPGASLHGQWSFDGALRQVGQVPPS